MASFMSSYSSQSYALLRIVIGLLFALHGSQKLLSFPIDAHAGMPWHITYVAGSIELVGGLLVAVGLFTTWAAFLSSGLMAAAYWMVHGMNAFFPMENKGELAVVYCFVFLFISAQGSGIWSFDASRK